MTTFDCAPCFSVFGKGIKQTRPEEVWDIKKAYDYLISDEAKEVTEHLRTLSGDEARGFKAANFRFCTFSGVFQYRSAKNLTSHSGLMTIDIDDIDNPDKLEEIRRQLIADRRFSTALLFTSPSGNGIKWIPYVGSVTAENHGEWFDLLRNYLVFEYGIVIDKSGRDVCRTCFLPYDADCYINPEYTTSDTIIK